MKNLYFFLDLILSVLSYVIPKNKKMIVLGSRYGKDFSGNPKYFFLYLLQRKNNKYEEIFWITKNKKILVELEEKQLPILYIYSWKGFKAILRSQYLVISFSPADVSYGPLLFGNFNFIQTYHGAPTKGSNVIVEKSLKNSLIVYLSLRRKKSYKVFLTASKRSKKKYQKRGFVNIEILGYPQNDILFDVRSLYEDYKTKLDLGKYKKIILYAPTFRDRITKKIPFSNQFLKIFNDYLSENDSVFLVKQHPREKSKLYYDSYSNIINISDNVDDIQDILPLTDLLITDYSSVVTNFALLERPIIFYPYDIEEYSQMRNMKQDYYKDMPVPFVYNEEELLLEISSDKIHLNKTDYKQRFQKFQYDFNQFTDDKSSERLYKFLINLK